MRISDFTMIFLGCLLMCSCHRKDKTPTAYVDKEMLRYCWFPDGSYWIYEEANTPGLMDSTYVTNRYTEILPDYGEGFRMERYGNGIVIGGKQYAQGRTAWPSGPSGTVTIMSQSRTDIAGPNEDVLFFWDDGGTSVLSYHPNTKIVARYDSLRIRNIDYLGGIEVVIEPPQAANHCFQSIFVRNVGVVQRSMTDGTVWNLVRYKIN